MTNPEVMQGLLLSMYYGSFSVLHVGKSCLSVWFVRIPAASSKDDRWM